MTPTLTRNYTGRACVLRNSRIDAVAAKRSLVDSLPLLRLSYHLLWSHDDQAPAGAFRQGHRADNVG